jgi:hypothetical protein
MRAQFVKGKDPKAAMGLGLVTIELDYHNFYMDEDNPGKPDLTDAATKYEVTRLKDSGLKYKFKQSDWGPVLITLTGSRDQLAPFVAEYLDEPVEMVRNAFSQWDGIDQEDLWNLMGY